jgi:hypothetical protein
MTLESPFTRESVSRTDPVVGTASTLLCGAGIDASAAGALGIGITNATTITIGQVGQTVSFPGTISPTPSIANGVQKKTVTVAFDNAALAAAATNGLAASVNIGTALASNARILGFDMRSLTPFNGGGASAVSVDVGTSGDVNALIATADVFGAAVDGGPATMPLGVRPNKTFAAGGQLIATFTPDAGHKLSLLTAGSVVIDVLYTILA